MPSLPLPASTVTCCTAASVLFSSMESLLPGAETSRLSTLLYVMAALVGPAPNRIWFPVKVYEFGHVGSPSTYNVSVPPDPGRGLEDVSPSLPSTVMLPG